MVFVVDGAPGESQSTVGAALKGSLGFALLTSMALWESVQGQYRPHHQCNRVQLQGNGDGKLRSQLSKIPIYLFSARNIENFYCLF